MVKASPIVPRVNLSGTYRNTLMTQQKAVRDAALGLMDALGKAVPEARDYPDPVILLQAKAILLSKLEAVMAIHKEAEDQIHSIRDQR